jgi:ABC-type uncharacterized transport system permease subunit
MWIILAGLLSIVLYMAAAGILGARLISDHNLGAATRPWTAGVAGAALVLHSLVLYQGVVTAAGLNLGFFNALSLVAWLIVMVVLVVALTRPVENLGLAVLPLAAVTLLLSLAVPADHVLVQRGFGLDLHIILAILAYSVLSVAAVQAILVAFQDRQLRQRRPGGIMRALPPLQTMESLLFQMIAFGFFLLSLAIISGTMFLDNMFAQHVAHKTILSIAAWLIFAVLLWGRWQFGWRGRVAIRWSLTGFVALALAYFGSKLVLELVLGYR